MRSKLFLFVVASLVITMLGCKKSEDAVINSSHIDEVTIPADFTWQNSSEISLFVGISDTRFQNAPFVISIYNGDPSDGGSLIARGAASLTSPFNVRLAVANIVDAIYVEKTAPDLSRLLKKVPVSGISMSISMGANEMSSATLSTSEKRVSGLSSTGTSSTEINCNTGCTSTITNNNNNITVNNNDEVICITGSNINVGINANGGTIRICGVNVTVTNATLNNSARLIVTKSGVVNFSNINMNGASTFFENHGTVTIKGSFSLGGGFENDGILSVNGDFSLNSGSSFTNNENGVIDAESSMSVSSSNLCVNYGKIDAGAQFKVNSDGHFVNHCTIYARNQVHNSGELENYSLIKADNGVLINSGSSTFVYNGSMIKTEHLILNAAIIGSGTTSLIKVSKQSNISPNGEISGTIQYCDVNGIEANNGRFINGARLGCDLYIPLSTCNSEGNGFSTSSDSDGDGITDALDAYPHDSEKAFNNYYPSAEENAASTLAFEDLWPVKGDYDMNDIVISYHYNVITNAQNKVIQVNAVYKLLASGGDLKNGFGVEFPVGRTNISSMTGANLETGQIKAVAIVFTNSRDEQQYGNTQPGKPVSSAKTYNVSFRLKAPILLSDFGLGSYNPFIWNSNAGRGNETHLAGKTPTSLANTALFGTGDDRSGGGKYYLTSKHLPWAIDIPIGDFRYPIEKVEISLAYLNFTNWAISGGSSFRDWYSNTDTKYRDASKLIVR